MGRKIRADFAVIGAGSFGSWTALELLRRGYSVVLADAHGPANARASSGGETRIIRMSYGDAAHYSDMSNRSLVSWTTLFDFLKRPELFENTGALFTAPGGNSHLADSAEVLRKLKIPFQRLNQAALSKRYPQLRLKKGSEGIFEPNSGVLMARRAVQAVAEHAVQLGALYLQRAFDPASIEKEISARAYIFACGPWLPKLFPQAIGSRIRVTRQDVYFFGVPPGDTCFQLGAMPAWVDFHAGVYALPDLEGRGLKIAYDKHGPEFDPENGTRLCSSASYGSIRKQLQELIPSLATAPLLETRVCQYENTSNGDLLIDWIEPGRVMAIGGGSGHGFKHGPAVGKYAADLAEGRTVPEWCSLASKQVKHARQVF
jgi:sarcosine oxidase